MKPMHFRIDDRLIHGIVAGYWTNHLKANRIMVIDESAANDDIIKASLRMACPKNVGLSVLTLEKATNNILAGNYEAQDVFVIAKSPETFASLQKAGVTISQVNMGNITYTTDRIKVSKTVSVNQNEIDALKHLASCGASITSQLIPSDPVEDFMSMLENSLKK